MPDLQTVTFDASQWQPIETAPKEMELLGWREDCGPLLVMHTSFDRFASEHECDETDEETLFQKDWFGSAIPGGFERLEGSQTPTHWMPIPAAPGAAPTPAASTAQTRYLQGFEDAIETAAFYVADHCVDGETHAEAIRTMKRPSAAQSADHFRQQANMVDHSGEATEKVSNHVADSRNMVAAQSAGQEAVARYIVVGYGESDYPIAAFANDADELLDAVLGMMYTKPSDACDDTREEYRRDLADEDEWCAKVWRAEFEIGGVVVYDTGERAAPVNGGERAADAQQECGSCGYTADPECPICSPKGIADTQQVGDIRGAAQYVHDALKRDLDAGYTTKDKVFAVEVLGAALQSPAKVGGDGLIEQHARDSTELRRLCAARDEARRTAEYWKANHLAGNAEIERLKKLLEAKVGGDERDAERLDWLMQNVDAKWVKGLRGLPYGIDMDEYLFLLREAIDDAIAANQAHKEQK